MDESKKNEAAPAERVIERFGGIRPMAAKLRAPVTTVQYWKKRGAIPASRRQEILDAAKRNGVALDPAELDAALSVEAEPAATRAEEPIPVENADAGSDAGGASPATTPDSADAAGGAPATEAAQSPATEAAQSDASHATPPTSSGADESVADDQTPPVAPPVSPPQRPDRSARALGAAALVAALGLGGAALWLATQESPAGDAAVAERLQALEEQAARPTPTAGPELQDALRRLSATEERLASAERTLAAARERIAELEARPAGAGADPAAVDALRARLESQRQTLDGLGERIGALDQSLASLDQRSGQRLTTLEQRTATLSQLRPDVQALEREVAQLQAATSRTGAFALAAGQLNAAVTRSDSYANELAAVRALADPENQTVADAIRSLEPYAFNGVPTLPQLRAQFAALAPDVLRAAAPPADDGVWGQIQRKLGGLVTVRRAPGAVEGDDPAAILARAEARLERDDLPGALEELDGLTGAARETAANWMRDANARLFANQAASAIAAEAAQRLAEAPGGETAR